MAKILILIGIAIVFLGLVIQFAPFLINWFGKLPGDIRWEGENTKVFIPITSMILISLLLTLIMNLWK